MAKGVVCWNWTGHARKGYGYLFFTVDGKQVKARAHRFSYELHFGKIPGNFVVCHSCDNGLCVRPDHLWVGTDADNVRDRVEKGRTQQGERHYKAVLTAIDVQRIKERLLSGEKRRKIAADYGVSIQVILRIDQGKTWASIPPLMSNWKRRVTTGKSVAPSRQSTQNPSST